jgi:hypothetical protein
MTGKWFVPPLLVFLLGGLGVGYLRLSGRIAFLVLNRRVGIEINGMPVRGEVLQGRATAIVTRRDPGKEHSYQLFFEGDADSAGNVGSVMDCDKWVAPHLPVLLETRSYPPCGMISESGTHPQRRSLIQAGSFVQFVAVDGSTISVSR